MKWINSTGGPLMVIGERALPAWSGTTSKRGEPSDYERACAVSEYVDVLHVSDDVALVLGDEPLQTTWLSATDARYGTLIRWRYAPSEERIIALASGVVRSAPSHEVAFHATDALYYLFDAACDGKAVRRDGDYLKMLVKPGTYRLQTVILSESDDIAALLHQFVPV